MSIRRRLSLTFLLYSAIILSLVIGSLFAWHQFTHQIEQMSRAEQLLTESLELLLLSDDYLSYHNDRSLIQVQAKISAINALLNQEEYVIFSPVKEYLIAYSDIFYQITQNSIFETSTDRPANTQSEAQNLLREERLSAMIRLEAQKISHQIEMLVSDSNQMAAQMRQRILVFFSVYFLSMSFLLVLLTQYTIQKIIRPLNELMAGAEKVEKGDFNFNFDFHAPETNIEESNEIGQLALAFNRMTSELVKNIHKLTEETTIRAQKETALLESENRYRTIVETAREGVWLIDQNGITTFVNQQMANILEYKPEEMIGKSLMDFTDPAGQQDASDKIEKRKQGEYEINEFMFIKKTGERCYAIVSTAPMPPGPGGEYSGAFAMITDITPIKLAGERLQKLNESLEMRVAERTQELEEVNQELESFAYSISHDLRAPLRAINGLSNLLTEEYSHHLPEAGLHYLDLVQKNVAFMTDLINGLLEFSRKGRGVMHFVNVDFNTIVKDILQIYSDVIETRNIQISVSNLPQSVGDPLLLKQVVQNLIENAIKFTRYSNKAEIRIDSFTKNGKNGIAVHDNGVGFDMKYANQLFGVFQRLHSQSEFEGTGIGLAIVKRIIHRHGGEIWCTAKPDEGASFYFTLDISNQPQSLLSSLEISQ